MPVQAENTSPSFDASLPQDSVSMLPPPPRPIDDRYAWRLLMTDGWAIAAFVCGLLGAIFTLVGVILTVGIITAFMGLPLAGSGILLFGGGVAMTGWRYQYAQKMVKVLRTGEAGEGEIVHVEENSYIRVNARHPWVIRYQFPVGGQTYEGQVSTLNMPGAALQPGHRACVLYLPQAPGQNVLYPHP